MKTEDLIAAETALREKLAEAARKRPRVKGRFVAEVPVSYPVAQSRAWLAGLAWLLLGAVIGWAACAIVGGR